MAEQRFDHTLEDDVITRVHRHYKEARDHSSEWRGMARESFDFEAGHQWDEEDQTRLQDDDRPAVTIDRVSRTLNAIVGTQINNRQETRYIPREMGDIQVNEILTGAGQWARDECDAEDEETDAFRDLLVCGMGWTQTDLDYDDEPDGMIGIDRRDPLWMYWDPAARKKNLIDRRWQLYIRSYSHDEFAAAWPGVDLEAASSPWDDAIEDDDGGIRKHVYPQDAYDEQQARGGRDRKEIRVGFEEYWKYETFWRVGEAAMELTDADYQRLLPKLEERGIRSVKQRRKVYRRAIVAGNEVLEDKEALDPKGFSFHCMTGRRDRNRNIWIGLVETMKDPQRWGNKFFSQILDIINKNSKGGVIIEKDATDDIRDFEEKWARPDAVHIVNSGAIAQQKILPKPMGSYPSGLDKLMEFALDSVAEVIGVSLETLGLANRDQANVLEQSRKQAAITILSLYFDAMRRHRKGQGRTMLRLIRMYISDGRLIRIMGQGGHEQFIPLVRDAETAKYDVIVDEAPTSPNQKERVFSILQAMMPSLAKMGITPPKEILDYTPLPSKVVQAWKAEIEQGNKIPPEIQKQLGELQKENAQLKDKRGEAQAGLSIKQGQAQNKMQIQNADMERKREESQFQFQLKREEVQAELDLMREKVQAELEMKAIELKEDIELERERARADVEIEIAKLKAKENERHDLHNNIAEKVAVSIPNKKKVTVNRAADGFIDTLDIVTVQ